MATDAARRVLVISFRFPPHGGGGVQRTAYFTKYLSRNGWRPHVLTGPGDCRRLQDASLLQVIPEDVPVTRTGMLGTERFLQLLGRVRLARVARTVTPSLPNMTGGWIPHAYRAGLRLLESREFDLIYSSAYPMASHVVACLLKRKTGLPWVADYRDEWSTRALCRWPSPLHRWLAGRLDRRLMAASDFVVTTSAATTQLFSREFPARDPSKYVTVTNGFDEEDFAAARKASRGGDPEAHRNEGRFRIALVGSVFPWHKPELFLRALDRLIEARVVRADQLDVVFVGNSCELRSDRLQRAGVIRRLDYVDHATALRWMLSADVLLLTNGESGSIPGKTFEYLAAERPILAILPPGPAADIVERTGSGRVVGLDVGEIAAGLQAFLRAWQD